MKFVKENALLAVVFVVSALISAFVVRCCFKPSKPEAPSKQVVVAATAVAQDTVPTTAAEPAPATDTSFASLFAYDTLDLMYSFEPWMVFSENFNASYRDSSFWGNYQLVYPIGGPHDKLIDSKFGRILLSELFGKNAPKKVNRKTIQAALNGVMKQDIKTTHRWWNEAKVEYGKNWRDEVMLCTGYFYAMPTESSSSWISFQQIEDYRCGGNGGPSEKYYTIVAGRDPYIVDTTVFVPGFREKLYDMITDNVIYNFYGLERARRFGRAEIRQATVAQFGGNFRPTLMNSGVKFVFGVWGLPGTCHADGKVPVIVPYRMIQEIFTEKFKRDIGYFFGNY